MQMLVNAAGVQLELKPWPRPKRIVSTIPIYVGIKKLDAVTTRGEKYAYLCIEGVDLFVEGTLTANGRYKVKEVKEEVPA